MASATRVELDPQTVLVPECDGPFSGITLEQARLVNVALYWLPVEVVGGGAMDDGKPKTYVFEGILLPNSWAQTPFEYVGDLRLMHMRDDGRPRRGSSRVLSATLVRSFRALALDPFRCCSACSRMMTRTQRVHDVGGLSSYLLPNGEFEWESRFECEDCW